MERLKQKELISKMSGRQLVAQLFLSQVLLLSIAVILHFILRGKVGTLHWGGDLKWIVTGLISGGIVAAMDIFLMKVLPVRYYDDGGLNEKIFRRMPLWLIPLVALLVAFTEEYLFRGIVQTSIGLVAASIIFSVIHIRYLSHWYLLVNIVLLSFWIGGLYEFSGRQMLPVICMHFAIDFILGVHIRLRSSNDL